MSGVIAGAAQEAHHRNPTIFSTERLLSGCPSSALRLSSRRWVPTTVHLSNGQLKDQDTRS